MATVALLSVFDDSHLGLRILDSWLSRGGHRVLRICLKAYEEVADTPAPDSVSAPEFGYPLGITERELGLLVDLLRDEKVEVLGVSAFSNYVCQNAVVTERVKGELGIPVVWGGPDATVNPDIALRWADAVVRGEADEIICDLVEALVHGEDPAHIPGVWFRRKDGIQADSGPPLVVRNLDDLPFPNWRLDNSFVISGESVLTQAYHPRSWVNERYLAASSSRGCPYSCTYCVHGYHAVVSRSGGGRFRRMSPQRFVEELAAARRLQPDLAHVCFADDIFPLNASWIRAFSEAYLRKVGLAGSCYACPATASRETIQPLLEYPMREIGLGVQSGSDRTNREDYGRKMTREAVLSAASLFTELGIRLLIDILIGNPLETEGDYRSTLDLLRQLPRPYAIANVHRLHLYRNLPLTNRLLKGGENLRQVNYSTFMAEEDPVYEYWAALYCLDAYTDLSDAGFESLLTNQGLRENPTGLFEAARGMKKAMTFNETAEIQHRTDDRLRELERELAALRESRAVRLARRLSRLHHRGGRRAS